MGELAKMMMGGALAGFKKIGEITYNGSQISSWGSLGSMALSAISGVALQRGDVLIAEQSLGVYNRPQAGVVYQRNLDGTLYAGVVSPITGTSGSDKYYINTGDKFAVYRAL